MEKQTDRQQQRDPVFNKVEGGGQGCHLITASGLHVDLHSHTRACTHASHPHRKNNTVSWSSMEEDTQHRFLATAYTCAYKLIHHTYAQTNKYIHTLKKDFALKKNRLSILFCLFLLLFLPWQLSTATPYWSTSFLDSVLVRAALVWKHFKDQSK